MQRDDSAERHASRRLLKSQGCTCHAMLETIEGGLLVTHKVGCRLGDAVKRWNEAGVVPAIFYEAAARCER